MESSLLSDCFTKGEMEDVVSKLSPLDIGQQSSTLSSEQVVTLSTLLKGKIVQWKEKLLALLIGVQDRKDITLISQNLILDQLITILEQAPKIEADQPWKLYSLFVGITPDLFKKLLIQASPQIFESLKKEGIAEPVQHHLNNLSNELSKEVFAKESMLVELEEKIVKFDLHKAMNNDMHRLRQEFNYISSEYYNIINLVDKALVISWNSNRTDLIEKFTWVKERACKSIIFIGTAPDSSRKNLQSLLKARIDDFYSNAQDPLDDQDLAIEALPKFSIWYKEDYEEVGLLPKKYAETIFEENDWVIQQSKINTDVQILLKTYGIETVKDLKDLCIFSKESLKEFIKSHKY